MTIIHLSTKICSYSVSREIRSLFSSLIPSVLFSRHQVLLALSLEYYPHCSLCPSTTSLGQASLFVSFRMAYQKTPLQWLKKAKDVLIIRKKFGARSAELDQKPQDIIRDSGSFYFFCPTILCSLGHKVAAASPSITSTFQTITPN